jgi:dihydrofolate reductase
MRKLAVFNHVSLDGYFVDSSSSMTWAKAHHQDPEWNAFVAENASGESPLLFGRVTYQLMASYWPTPLAKQHDDGVAERMNALPKVVFSRTLDNPSWNNTKLVQTDMPGAVRQMKQESGADMVILGSGSIVSQLAQEELIDQYQIVVNPIILGKGRTMFDGLKDKLALKLTKTRAFRNGNIFLSYEPAAAGTTAAV